MKFTNKWLTQRYVFHVRLICTLLTNVRKRNKRYKNAKTCNCFLLSKEKAKQMSWFKVMWNKFFFLCASRVILQINTLRVFVW